MASNIYNIDYKKLVALLLLPVMRTAEIFAFVKACIEPVITIYESFITARTQHLYQARRNGQVCYLRATLNDYFDPTHRRIYIAHGQTSDWVMAYKSATFNSTDKGVPIWSGHANSTTVAADGKITLHFTSPNRAKLISKQSELGTSGFDFLIMVPSALYGTFDESRMTSIANFYKLASKRYSINYF